MAISDYITCCKCDVKLIYDGGKDNNRQWWEKRWGKEPEIMCPDCEKKLRIKDDYERGFIDGMQEQMKRSVDKAVNRLARREWVGLTDEQLHKDAAQYATNRKNAYLEKMKRKEVDSMSEAALNGIWLAHYEGYREGYWVATGDVKFSTDPAKPKEKTT